MSELTEKFKERYQTAIKLHQHLEIDKIYILLSIVASMIFIGFVIFIAMSETIGFGVVLLTLWGLMMMIWIVYGLGGHKNE